MQIDQAFPSRCLRAADLGGTVVPVVIDRLEQEFVGRDKELKPILYFRGKAKGLVVNETNARRIAELLRGAEHRRLARAQRRVVRGRCRICRQERAGDSRQSGARDSPRDTARAGAACTARVEYRR